MTVHKLAAFGGMANYTAIHAFGNFNLYLCEAVTIYQNAKNHVQCYTGFLGIFKAWSRRTFHERTF